MNNASRYLKKKIASVITSMIESFKIFEDGVQVPELDNIPPLILVPSDITAVADDKHGAIVEFSVKGIDNIDGVIPVSCVPSSSSYFPIGTTIVHCNSEDSAGNRAEKSFVITVEASSIIIPEWIKNVAGFWCDNEIEDSAFVEGIRYLIDNNVIIISAESLNTASSQQIPKWVKNNACWWSTGQISDSDFATSLKYLIEQGIIII